MSTRVEHIKNKFYKIVDGLECVLEYDIRDDNTIVFYHTYVSHQIRSRGLAQELIKAGLDYVVENKLNIVPACSAVRRYMDRNRDYEKYLK